jgi:hypothetical protein
MVKTQRRKKRQQKKQGNTITFYSSEQFEKENVEIAELFLKNLL